MNRLSALKVVEHQPFYRRDIQFSESELAESHHSLHYSLLLPDSISPEVAAYFISKFSRKGEVVLDPFAGSGVTPLEAALVGRVAYAFDDRPLSHELIKAKLIPADLTEVTLKLQGANLRRPVDLGSFNRTFSAFYDVDTYRELVNLREYIAKSYDRTARFIQLLTLSLLHGNNAGYLSVYSLPHLSLTPAEQQQVNFKRGQIPDYRPLVPRILRKAAGVFRDGIPSVLYNNSSQHRFGIKDSRDLSEVRSSSVNLVVTAPPVPGSNRLMNDQLWLRNWFARLENALVSDFELSFQSNEAWELAMNESLTELARVVIPGGRAVLCFYISPNDNMDISYEELIQNLVQEDLCRFWEAEGMLIEKQPSVRIREGSRERDPSKRARYCRALILRRR